MINCKPHQRGLNSSLTATILGMYPVEFAEYIVKMTECNLKTGMTPEFARRVRLSQIPKLSHADLQLLNARRFLALQHILSAVEGKHVTSVMSDHFEYYDIIPEEQHGFRKARLVVYTPLI